MKAQIKYLDLLCFLGESCTVKLHKNMMEVEEYTNPPLGKSISPKQFDKLL